jgi:hypothetical protein
MRAHGRKYEMGKRFAIVICVAATGVMALGAQTGAQVPDVVKYDTRLTIEKLDCDPSTGTYSGTQKLCGGMGVVYQGHVRSEVKRCREERRVILFRKWPGPDRKLGATRSTFHIDGRPAGRWGLRAPERGRVYAKVTPEVGDGFECLADYSLTITCWHACAKMRR